jgi:uncharacterized protein YlxW (UPF0749 family)
MMPPFVMKAIWAVVIVIAIIAGFKWWLAEHDKSLLAGYVLLSEKTALQAQLNEVERQRNAAAQSLEEYRKRSLADEQQSEIDRQRMEKAIADDTGDGAVWSDADRRWLCDQGIASACSR